MPAESTSTVPAPPIFWAVTVLAAPWAADAPPPPLPQPAMAMAAASATPDETKAFIVLLLGRVWGRRGIRGEGLRGSSGGREPRLRRREPPRGGEHEHEGERVQRRELRRAPERLAEHDERPQDRADVRAGGHERDDGHGPVALQRALEGE